MSPGDGLCVELVPGQLCGRSVPAVMTTQWWPRPVHGSASRQHSLLSESLALSFSGHHHCPAHFSAPQPHTGEKTLLLAALVPELPRGNNSPSICGTNKRPRTRTSTGSTQKRVCDRGGFKPGTWDARLVLCCHRVAIWTIAAEHRVSTGHGALRSVLCSPLGWWNRVRS